MFDLILRGGLVYDGGGGPAQRADIGIVGDRIDTVSPLDSAAAVEVIDVSGLAVAPGFIDVHAHTDLLAFLPEEHTAIKVAGLLQGVTTEVCGNCGASPFPLRADGREDPYLGAFAQWGLTGFTGAAEYREQLSRRPLAANVAPLLGHGTVRATAMGREDRAPMQDELKEMRRLTAQAMDDGAFGLSTGLIYSPGQYSATEEIIALASEVARYQRPYTTHMRDEGDRVEEAVAEALRIGREAGVAVQVSHHKIGGRRNWGRSAKTLAQIEAARAQGVDVTIDSYPYTAGSTFLAALLPPWALEGGVDATTERMRDGAARDRVKRDIEAGLAGWSNLAELAGWANVVIAGEPPLAGQSIQEIAESQGQDPVDVVADVLLETPSTMIIIHLMDQQEVQAIGEQPYAMVGSDGIPLPGQQHPRLAGTFARVLGQHRGDATALADAVRRMTSLPAGRFNIPQRGKITPGFFADLVVFDPATVNDRATYEAPLLPPDGIAHVVMAGDLVVRDGAFKDRWVGRVLEPIR